MALQKAQCILLETKYEPSMPAQDPYAASLTACREKCSSTPRCKHFTFWSENRGCLLQEASAVASHEVKAAAGPGLCIEPPGLEDRIEAKAEGQGSFGLVRAAAMHWFLLMASGLVALACLALGMYLGHSSSLFLHDHFTGRRESGRMKLGPSSAQGRPLAVPYQPLLAEVPAGNCPADLTQEPPPTPGTHEMSPAAPQSSCEGAAQEPPPLPGTPERSPAVPPGSGQGHPSRTPESSPVRPSSSRGGAGQEQVRSHSVTPERSQAAPSSSRGGAGQEQAEEDLEAAEGIEANSPWMPRFLGPEALRRSSELAPTI